jgi:thiol-disulfide isomerase/thioredoxin
MSGQAFSTSPSGYPFGFSASLVLGSAVTRIVGLPAPPLENIRWIDENGDDRNSLTLIELGQGFRILYFFQDWCAGCHAHGFPTFVTLAEGLRDKGVGLAAIQTVFEGFDVNTFGRLQENQRRYGLRVPFGHAVTDSASADAVPPIMEAYRSGGTPWFVVIAPDGRVVYDGFRLDAKALVQALRPLAA